MSKSIQARYDALYVQFTKTTQREKWLILLSGAGIIILLQYLFIIEPLSEQTRQYEQNISAQRQQLSVVRTQLEISETALKNDPNQQLAKSLEKLRQNSLDLDRQLQQQTVNLVPATQMPSLLEKVLTDSKGVTLVSLQSIPPSAVLGNDTPQTQEAMANSEQTGAVNLYRHGVMLSVKGSYFDIQNYLQKIEALQWQFYWKRFNYVVSEYPEALVEVELYTLSTSQAFIGV